MNRQYIKARCANCGTEYIINANLADGACCKNCNGGPLKLLGFTDKPTARNGNISLEVEEYCFGCEEFMPVRKIERIYTGDNPTEINVTVQCGQKDRCRRIADRIQAPRPKKSAF